MTKRLFMMEFDERLQAQIRTMGLVDNLIKERDLKTEDFKFRILDSRVLELAEIRG